MTSFRLWPDELEVLRAEARAAVDAGSDFFTNDASTATTRDEQVAQQRATMASVAFAHPDAQERELNGVACRVFPHEGARAVYLHFHGGGMIAGSPMLMDIPNGELAKTHNVTVVSSDYRKAPEHPWPAGPDDGLAVAQWLVEHASEEFGTDRIVIGGESAGAYMAAIVAVRLRDELHAIDRVHGLNLTFGIYDWSGTPSQRGLRAHDGFDVLSADETQFVRDCFVPNRTDEERRAPKISPLYADLRGLPPCFVSVGTCDHLFDDSILFASHAAAAGVDVELLVLPELPHAFQAFNCGLTKLWGERLDAWFDARFAG